MQHVKQEAHIHNPQDAKKQQPTAEGSALTPEDKAPKHGPRTKCEPALIEAITKQVRKGASITAACGMHGIDEKSFRNWEAKAGDGEEPYASYLPLIKRARATARAIAERRVFRGKGVWTAAARWLESQASKDWTRMTRSDVTHQGGGKPIPVDMKLGAALVRTMIAESARPGVPGLGDRFKGTN